jgi:beta-glucosidase
VFSDWFGTHSAAQSLRAGLDLEMPGPPRERGPALLAAVEDAPADKQVVDQSVRRMLRLFEWSGVGATRVDEVTDDSPATREVIRRAAIAGSVLLKSDRDVLPLSDGASIALVGPNARRPQVQGGGSAQVRANRVVTIEDALLRRGLTFVMEDGCTIHKRLPALRGQFTVAATSADGLSHSDELSRMTFLWQDPPAEGVGINDAMRVDGSFTPQASGPWTFGLTAVGAARLHVNGRLVAAIEAGEVGGAFFGQASDERRVTVDLRADEPVDVRVDMDPTTAVMLRGLIVGAQAPQRGDEIERAALAAAGADVAVVVVGTNSEWETEGEDRTTMDLPGEQNVLVARVAAANPNTVVVVNAGSPVTMPWIDDVAAVLQVWFPGEEFGNALADMLLGVAEPGGRLPVTLPRRLADTPAHATYPGADGHMAYEEGTDIGYRWYLRRDVDVLFPFGHGLGYTTFDVGTALVSGDVQHGVTVDIPVSNTGRRAGSHVVQVYVDPPAGDPRRPVRTLAGFAKIALESGESTTAQVWLPERAFSVWSDGWVVPPGDYSVMVGSSSADVALAGVVSVTGSATTG